MAKGTVKWFNRQKGFGFIAPTDGGADIFVHFTALEKAGIKELKEGQSVTYDVQDNKGRTVAANLIV